MLEYEQNKTLKNHLHRAAGHLCKVGDMLTANRSIYLVDQQLHAATASAINCYNNTFREILSQQASRAITFRLSRPGISKEEYNYFWNARYNLKKLSVSEILSLLDWLQHSHN